MGTLESDLPAIGAHLPTCGRQVDIWQCVFKTSWHLLANQWVEASGKCLLSTFKGYTSVWQFFIFKIPGASKNRSGLDLFPPLKSLHPPAMPEKHLSPFPFTLSSCYLFSLLHMSPLAHFTMCDLDYFLYPAPLTLAYKLHEGRASFCFPYVSLTQHGTWCTEGL